MRSSRRFGYPLLWLLALSAWVAVPSQPALAICSSPYLFGLVAGDYIYTPGVDIATGPSRTSVTDDVQGSFWAMGFGHPDVNRGIDNGGFPGWVGVGPHAQSEAFIYAYPGYPALISNHWASTHAIDGCITTAGDGEECMVILLTDQNAGSGYFALLGTTPKPSAYRFVFTPPPGSQFTLAPLPVPEPSVVRSRGASDITVSVASPQVETGLYLTPGCLELGDPIRGYRVYQQRLEPGALPGPGRDIAGAGWFGTSSDGECGEPPFVALGEAVEIEVACDRDTDIYLALSLVFDSGFETPVVSADSAAIPCRTCPAGTDRDGDGFCTVATGSTPADCDDGNASVYPGAPQACDGINNDCSEATWPAVAAAERDDDGDGFVACLKTITLQLPADNCPGVANPGQLDSDGDGIGDACDSDPGEGRQLPRTSGRLP